MKTKYYTLLMLLFLTFSCRKTQNCESITTPFPNYREALKTVKNTDFNFTESVYTGRKSSFIDNISYYSCNKKVGFLIVEIREKEYIYPNISFKLWQNFKRANSYGGFYQKYIRIKRKKKSKSKKKTT